MGAFRYVPLSSGARPEQPLQVGWAAVTTSAGKRSLSLQPAQGAIQSRHNATPRMYYEKPQYVPKQFSQFTWHGKRDTMPIRVCHHAPSCMDAWGMGSDFYAHLVTRLFRSPCGLKVLSHRHARARLRRQTPMNPAVAARCLPTFLNRSIHLHQCGMPVILLKM